jgi:hypothetical protein
MKRGMLGLTLADLFDVLQRMKAPLFVYVPDTNGLMESQPMYGLKVTACEPITSYAYEA